MANLLLTPAPDFTQPLDLLSACHRRINGFIDMLLRLPEHLLQHGADADAIQAAERALKYFNSSGQHHHEDEEQDLFPMLREAAQSAGNGEILMLLEDLLAQHAEMNQAWQDLRTCLVALTRGEADGAIEARVRHFAELYRKHIPLEENFALPYAERTLSSHQIENLGKCMARRRGIAP